MGRLSPVPAPPALRQVDITGVSPLLVDDLSSGFNIATNISQHPEPSTLAGFTRADVERAADELLASHPDLSTIPTFSDRGALFRVLEEYWPKVMRFTIENLGRLEEATPDPGKDPIVLTGPDNTSKTYVVHALYGLCQRICSILRDLLVAVLRLDAPATYRAEIALPALRGEHLAAWLPRIGEACSRLLADLIANELGPSRVTLAATESTDDARVGALFVESAGALSSVHSSGNRFGLVLQGDVRPTLDEGNSFSGNLEQGKVVDGDLAIPEPAPVPPPPTR